MNCILKVVICILMVVNFGACSSAPTCRSKKINKSGLDWNKEDVEILRSIMKNKRCSVHYPDSPCVKKFIKISELNYHVICGRGD